MNTCSFCGNSNEGVHKIRGTNNFQCRACYIKMLRENEANFLVCVTCSKRCYAEYRNALNEPICQSCYYRTKHYCYVCGHSGTYFNGRCKDCHEADRKRMKNCVSCGDLFGYRYDFRTMCHTCTYKKRHRKKEICASCNKLRNLSANLSDGSKICLYCYKKYYMKHTPCEMCGTITFCFNNQWVDKSICVRCSNKVRKVYKH